MTKRPKETLEQWATRILLHAHAIQPCPDHGYMRLRFSHEGIGYAHALAAHEPYNSLSVKKRIEAVDAAFDGLSDTCPGCE